MSNNTTPALDRPVHELPVDRPIYELSGDNRGIFELQGDIKADNRGVFELGGRDVGPTRARNSIPAELSCNDVLGESDSTFVGSEPAPARVRRQIGVISAWARYLEAQDAVDSFENKQKGFGKFIRYFKSKSELDSDSFKRGVLANELKRARNNYHKASNKSYERYAGIR